MRSGLSHLERGVFGERKRMVTGARSSAWGRSSGKPHTAACALLLDRGAVIVGAANLLGQRVAPIDARIR
jgi:hypothetical protein